MKAKLLISSLLLGTAILAIAKVEDPVLMTINGKDIKLSEFEYLYHKNSQQQVEKETMQQYVDRFVLYKQKVADAEAAGIDTTKSFIKEFEGYQKELAGPYMVEDTTYHWQFVTEAYDRYKKEIDIDHFMLPTSPAPGATLNSIGRMDSIRTCILNGEKWETLADKYSSDQSVSRNHGHYRFVSSCMFPYDFENVVYNTPVGEVSKPFVTKYGVHMIRVNQVRDRDDVHAKHILKLFPKDATDEQKASCKAQMDSIYKLLKAGADFEEMAKAESQDGSKRRGGDLGWFGRGSMVQPFENVAFDLADGEISEPFETQYGYHIIKKIAHGYQYPTINDMRNTIENAIKQDGRSQLIRERRLADLKSKYGYALSTETQDYLAKALEANGACDSAFIAQTIRNCDLPLFTYGTGTSVPVKSLLSELNPKIKIPVVAKAKEHLNSCIDVVADKVLTDFNARELVKTNPDYRNLLNEYRDGCLK